MNAEQFAALQSAATEGIDSDGLTVTKTADTYEFVVPEASYSGLSENEFHAAARRHREHVSEWYFWDRTVPDDPTTEAFLRWLERTPDQSVPERRDALQKGVAREWGQLRVRAHMVEAGRRVYEIRHVDDGDERVEDLTVHTDPLDARDIAKEDERGRYRPLATAPTLQRGWVFVDLTPEEAVQTVDTFYPATIANWHREREGELDVTHWKETAERQTGIYGLVETLDRGEGHAHAEWIAEACCADSECLKRREWQYDEGTDLEVDGGDGEFPCREPCSLVISAAREWAQLEGEDEQTYEFTLTPGEKAQVEAIVEAVADGRVEEIREGDFDDDANRWRARYLRAKRMADGTLDGPDEGPDE